MKKIILLTLTAIITLSAAAQSDRIDLSGLWRFQPDPMGFGKTAGSELYLKRLTESITLPGTTDEAGKGIANTMARIDRLSRKYEYCGAAWYQREVEIPAGWADKDITLELERCHWETAVYVDNRHAGTDERLSTPNRFNLTKFLTPGTHTITICVDNTIKYPMDTWTHGTSEYTQTNWNGIVGHIRLTARPKTNIRRLDIYPDADNRRVRVRAIINEGKSGGKLCLRVTDHSGLAISSAEININGDTASATLPIGKNARLWDEFSPILYNLSATLESNNTTDTLSETFGLRTVEQGKHHIRLNGRDIHLRGTLDCCVFPLTGYPATDVDSWLKIMNTVKQYGLNHVRFHSWCPPEAAFEAADLVGVYLQVELPMWIKNVGQYPARRNFFEKEMYALLDEYGNHPSFLLYCNGNENEGDFSVLEDLIVKGRSHDPRHLYSASTARTHVKADQFYASHVAANVGDNNKKWVTAYEGRPSTNWNLNSECAIDVPVISHETGQRCMYPNFREMSKYTGVLEPRNFKLYQERLTANGMLSQADDFFQATGAHTILQYKAVNEALLDTKTSAGFQLLGLTDFPGQGCAFVGVLDAFYDSKGLVSPRKYRESCAPQVLLARISKRVYSPADTLMAKIDLYNFGAAPVSKGTLKWQLTAEDGSIVSQGTTKHPAVAISTVDSIGFVSVPLGAITTPGKFTFKTQLDTICNEWNIWVYPQTPAPQTNHIAHTWSEARQRLDKGENVLLLTTIKNARNTHFASHFWNPVMFNWAPMIVGTLINHHHPALSLFPTDNYADWQWWDILNNTQAIDLTELTGLTPIIQSVDTYEHNRKLGIAFEANVGKGKLFVLLTDPQENIAKRPATRQLLHSIETYVNSDKFSPAATLQPWQLDKLFDSTPSTTSPRSNAVKLLLNQ